MSATYGKLYVKDANGTVKQFVPETYISNTEYEGATASANGVAGLVPPALSAQRNSVLRGDGSWHNVNYDKLVVLNSGAIDLLQGNYFYKEITATTTFTFSFPASLAPNDCTSFVLTIRNGGSYTVLWPSSVKWSNGIPPILSIQGLDILTFTTISGGTEWHASVTLYGA